MVDVDNEMAMHEALRAREELFRELTHALPVGVLQFDGDHRIVFTNERVREILGGATVRTLEDWLARIAHDDVSAFTDAAADVLATGDGRDVELRLDGDSTVDAGGRLVCHVNLRRVQTGGVNGLLLCVTDVTESATLRDELQIRATYDALTGCHNRSSTLRQLAGLLRAPSGSGAGVVFIDLDGFKPVNDHLGHAAGDAVLCIVAERLRSSTRTGDVIGRIGGDEFVVLSPGTTTIAQLDQLAQRLQTALDQGARIGAVDVAIRASIGTTLGAVGDVADLVLAAADAAMYEAKRSRARRTRAGQSIA
jgi:diguanylate cyclase (GGDEF)-like protein/PAS domain S-box-containing protein